IGGGICPRNSGHGVPRDTKRQRDLLVGEAVRSERHAQLAARLERRGPLHAEAAVLPRGAGVMFANAYAGDEQRTVVRVLLGEVVQRELAVIANDVVRREQKRRYDARAAEREV